MPDDELMIESIATTISAIHGVEGVGHLHVWPIDEATISLEVRIVVCDETSLYESAQIMERVRLTLAADYRINHVTLEPVPASSPASPMIVPHEPGALPHQRALPVSGPRTRHARPAPPIAGDARTLRAAGSVFHSFVPASQAPSTSYRLRSARSIAPASGPVSRGGRISIQPGLEQAHEFSVIVDELAHELLHRGDQRPASKTVRETEAEAVSFVVCQAIGLETGSAASDYIQLYDGKVETLAASLDRIQHTASDVIKALRSSVEQVSVA